MTTIPLRSFKAALLNLGYTATHFHREPQVGARWAELNLDVY